MCSKPPTVRHFSRRHLDKNAVCLIGCMAMGMMRTWDEQGMLMTPFQTTKGSCE